MAMHMRAGMRKLGLIAAILATVAQPAVATGFVNGRSQWQALTAEARIGYVQALNDSLNYVFADDSLAQALAKRGRTNCLVAQNMTALKLSELISIAYRNDRVAALPPSAVYLMQMSAICGEYINKARLDFGLGAQ